MTFFWNCPRNYLGVWDLFLKTTPAAAADEEPHILLVDHEDTVPSFISDGNIIKEVSILEFSEECNAVENIANGLLFFWNEWNLGEFFICNPLREEVLEMPQPLAVSTAIGTFREHLAFYGMGFDSATNSYWIDRVCELPRFGLSRRLPMVNCFAMFTLWVQLHGE